MTTRAEIIERGIHDHLNIDHDPREEFDPSCRTCDLLEMIEMENEDKCGKCTEATYCEEHCPNPAGHQTFRYCPHCTWQEPEEIIAVASGATREEVWLWSAVIGGEHGKQAMTEVLALLEEQTES